MFRRVHRFGVLLSFAATAACAADGIVFTRAVDGAPMPTQCAILAWRDGVQTLAIRTEMEASSGPAAWVVPTPSLPEIFEVVPGAVESARAGFAPRIERRDTGTLLPMSIGLLILVGGVHFAVGPDRSLAGRVLACGVIPIVALGVLLMPVLGQSRALSVERHPEVTVHEHRLVGTHEVAVISSSDAAALTGWLKNFGLTAPQAADAVIAEYCKEGWSFVAARLHDTAAGTNTPAPVGMRFRTDAPIYPMRLTGAGNALAGRTLDLELLIFGPGTATVGGMEIISSGPVERLAATEPHGRSSPRESVLMTHPHVLAVAEGATWATRLRGAFSPAAMRTDIAPVFGEGRAIRRSAVPRSAVLQWSLTCVIVALAGAGVLTVPVTRRRGWTWRRAAITLGAALVVGSGVAAFAAVGVQQVSVEVLKGSRIAFARRTMMYALQLKEPAPRTIDEARVAVEQAWAEEFPEAGPIRFGWAPGEFVIEEYRSGDEPWFDVGQVNWFGQYERGESALMADQLVRTFPR